MICPPYSWRFYILREFTGFRPGSQHLRDLEFLRENVGFQSCSQRSLPGVDDPVERTLHELSAKVYRNSAIRGCRWTLGHRRAAGGARRAGVSCGF